MNVFGKRDTLVLPTRQVRWVPPETIEGDHEIRIVIAKEAISTGWDCPRAEVLYSERSAKDATHIAQIVGRMVRQPLARRIATDDALNSVSCFLPNFNKTALNKIKAELERTAESEAEPAVAARLSRNPITFGRNPTLDAGVFDFVEELPSITTPETLASPLRRARKLAQLLTDDGQSPALMPDAGTVLSHALNRKLDGLAAQHSDDISAMVEDLETLDVDTDVVGPQGQEVRATTRQVATHLRDLDRDTRKVVRRLKEGTGLAYTKHRVDEAGDGADILAIRTEVAALLSLDGVVDEVHTEATQWTTQQLETHSVAIRNTTGSTRAAYRMIQEMTSEPETLRIELRDNCTTATASSAGDDLPTFSKHLFSNANDQFPARFNTWESEVIGTEIARTSTLAWYRNPARPSPIALRIAYQRDNESWTSVQPDFLIVSQKSDGTLGASIVDPHGDHLADALNKLLALADYAEAHGEAFIRIQSITKTTDGLRSLELCEPSVRQAVRAFEGSEVNGLYVSSVSMPYT